MPKDEEFVEVFEATVDEDVQVCVECGLALAAVDGGAVAEITEEYEVKFYHVVHAPAPIRAAHTIALRQQAAPWN